MSVINKMLKDLEQRHDDPEADVINAVYQPPVKNTAKYIVIALSLVVVGLAIAIGWLLLKDEPINPIQEPLVPVAQGNKVDSKPKKIQIKPLMPVQPSDKTAEDKVAMVDDVILEQTKKSKPEEQKVSETAAAVEVVKKVKPLVPVTVQTKTPEPKTKPMAPAPVAKSNPNPELTIVKSSEKYSPEQRLEQLMTKAQSSFDKGYVTEAVEKLNKVLSISDGHVEARNLLAVAWYGRGELQQAVSILNDGLSKYPNVELWRMTAAKIYFKENNIKGAFSYLDIELSNATLEFYSMKASIARKLERYESAESAYLMLTRLQPDLGNWWLGHAISLDSQGKFDAAILSYQTAAAKGGMLRSTMDFVENRIQELKQ